MHNNETKSSVTGLIESISALLPALFWGTLILGFEEASTALSTVICALIHEMGHIIFLIFFTNSHHSAKTAIFGFKIKAVSILSYKDEILLYLCGPLANLIFGVLFLAISINYGEFFFSFAIINFATAISNLIPIEGYDGYGILRALAEKRFPNGDILIFLSSLSSVLVFIFCILSIYFIDRYGGGYWIFAVFFVQMIKHFKKRLK